MVEGINVAGISPSGFTLDYGSFNEVSVGTAVHGAEWPLPGVQMQIISKPESERDYGNVPWLRRNDHRSREDGRLNLDGTLNERDPYDYRDIIIATVHLGNWDTNLDGNDAMTGRWSEDLTSLVFRMGTAHTDNELATMKRISKTAGGMSAQ
jgi:hypothetical protein